MPSPQNRRLHDDAVAHQVRLIRLANQLSADFVATLQDSEPDVLEVLFPALLRLEQAVGQLEFDAAVQVLREDLQEINDAAVAIAALALLSSLEQLLLAEEAFQSGSVATATGEELVPLDDATRVEILTQPWGPEGVDTLRPDEHFGQQSEWRTERTLEMVLAAIAAGLGLAEIMDATRDLIQGDELRRLAEVLPETLVPHIAQGTREQLWLANPEIVQLELWSSILDSRTTPVCRANSGATRPVGQRTWSNGYAGPYPAHWGERSVIVPQATAGQVATVDTFDAWLRGQPRNVVEEVLGPRRAELYLKGGLKDLGAYVNQRGRALTLDELRETEAGAFRRLEGAA